MSRKDLSIRTNAATPGFYVRLTNDLTINNGTTVLTMGTVRDNRGNCFSGSRFTAPVAGLYHFSANAQIRGGNGSGYGGVALRLNGSTFVDFITNRTADAQLESLSLTLSLAVSDYVEMAAVLDSTTASSYAQGFRTNFSGHFVS